MPANCHSGGAPVGGGSPWLVCHPPPPNPGPSPHPDSAAVLGTVAKTLFGPRPKAGKEGQGPEGSEEIGSRTHTVSQIQFDVQGIPGDDPRFELERSQVEFNSVEFNGESRVGEVPG